jgi:hypothetical protein
MWWLQLDAGRRSQLNPVLLGEHPGECYGGHVALIDQNLPHHLRKSGEVGLEVGVVEASGPPCRSTTVGRLRIDGPSGTSAEPSTSNHSRLPLTSTCIAPPSRAQYAL